MKTLLLIFLGLLAVGANAEVQSQITTVAQPPPLSSSDSLLPPGWDAVQAAQKVQSQLINICAPCVKGAHDSSLLIVDGKAYAVYMANDKQPGENPEWSFVYNALSVIDIESGVVDQIVPYAAAGQCYENMILPQGAIFVPRLIKKDEQTLRVFFCCESPRAFEGQTYALDYDIRRGAFENRLHKARMKTSQGLFDMQPHVLYQDAVAHGFAGPQKDYGLYPFDIKTFDGRMYAVVNNFPGGQNALSLLGEDLLTFEVLGHYNEPADMKLTESSVNRLPDGSWLAICRQEGGTRNYAFTESRDGRSWTPAEYRKVVPNGTSSKPTFDRFDGIYYLGWQQDSAKGRPFRSVFNIDVSRDGVTWDRKYHFDTEKSFQYPCFYQSNGHIYLTVTQGDTSGSRKERIMFGKLE